MSVSRLGRYLQCPMSYKLEKVDKKWSKPAAWLVQGSAFHEAPEHDELTGRTSTLDELEEVYTEAYYRLQDEALAETPNTDLWFRSGPYAAVADLSRRYGIGKEQVGKYVRWMEDHPEEEAADLPEGKAVEVAFEGDVMGIPVRGYIDKATKEHAVVDYKTGNRAGDPLQLDTYKVMMEKEQDFEVTHGFFWMGKTGKSTIPLDLRKVTEQSLADVYGPVYEDIKAEKFDPTPSDEACGFCGVKWACPVWN